MRCTRDIDSVVAAKRRGLVYGLMREIWVCGGAPVESAGRVEKRFEGDGDSGVGRGYRSTRMRQNGTMSSLLVLVLFGG